MVPLRFSLSSAYNLACNIVNEPLPIGISNWNWVWKLQLLPKLKFFIWKLLHYILRTTTFLNKRGINIVDACPFCDFSSNDLTYILRSCSSIKPLWTVLGIPSFLLKSFHDAFPTWRWLHANLTSKCLYSRPQLPW